MAVKIKLFTFETTSSRYQLEEEVAKKINGFIAAQPGRELVSIQESIYEDVLDDTRVRYFRYVLTYKED
ncbi:MAG: hypothetical protein K6F05_05810 [Succinivibrio sp.]|nr:hypothetical protein [Succinivibrio sp.]